MARGSRGKRLIVDLSTGHLHDEPLDEALCRHVLGGYGRGAQLLDDHLPPGVGAVMGSTPLKATAVSGRADVPLFDAGQAQALRTHSLPRTSGADDLCVQSGTLGISADAVLSSDALSASKLSTDEMHGVPQTRHRSA